MKSALLLSLLILFTSSCVDRKEGEQKTTLLSNFVSITDNEDKGIKEVLDFYGGQCKYSVGYFASTKEGKLKHFNLEMSQSDAIEKSTLPPQVIASNVAYLFYINLKEESDNYNEIHAILKYSNGEEFTFEFPVKELEVVKSRMPVVEKVVEIIKTKQYSSLKPYLNDSSSAVQYNAEDLFKKMEEFDIKVGDVKSFLPFGYRIIERENGMKFLRISGVIVREKQNHEFSATSNLNAPLDELLKIEYEF